MGVSFLFSGQASHYVGMGKALYDGFEQARAVFDEVDSALSQYLFRLMTEGTEESLRQTMNAQPAIMAVSVAAYRCFHHETGGACAPLFHAGHSLGEYSALVCAGSLDLTACAHLLRLRGQSMQKAVPEGEGSMAAVLGLDIDAVMACARIASEETQGCCVAANDNAPGQVVIAGDKASVAHAQREAEKHGAKKVLPLNVSAPFHCPLMQPAAETMAEALAQTELKDPTPPIISNVTAREECHGDSIRKRLVEQITAMVRWRDSMLYLQDKGTEMFIEYGPRPILCGMMKRIAPTLSCSHVGDEKSLRATCALWESLQSCP
ncbi:MAG: ACP S-malonyltransferase [Alphaproteobacteria bacterium GM7ARS4]|nr:ACP S-malonyltransferase [Alphaproteobacteria bacterium GM7ARS4]